jgi:tetratricopeptide (TPR) repeat protein
MSFEHKNSHGSIFFSAVVVFAMTVLWLFSIPARAARLDEMSLDSWAKLREVERYQLQIAEKYYRQKNWKIAMAEYEKFLTLYEQSEGAAYSQLKWSLCLVHLRKINTAIKEGFQSVVDYWPDSPQAVAAAYYIGKSYKDMGEIAPAKKAYQDVLAVHPKHLAAVYATVDLIDLSKIEDDTDARVWYWKRLTFETVRTKESERHCVEASRQLAQHLLGAGAFGDAVKALQTTYAEDELVEYVHRFAFEAIRLKGADSKTRAAAGQLADLAIGYFRDLLDTDPSAAGQQDLARRYWHYMADFHAAARRDAKVPDFYKQIIDRFGNEDQTLRRLADWYKSQGRYDEARAQYTRFKDKIEGQNLAAISYRDQQQYEPAVLAFRRAIALDPENHVKWNSEIANTYHYHAHKYDAAIAVYEELLKTDSEHAEKWRWQIATAYRDAGKYKQAIGHYRQCTNFPSNYREMAMCHRRLKNYQEAIVLYGQIMGGAPKSAPWALLEIGLTQEQAGQKEKAIGTFRQVCKRFPKDRHAGQAHARLQSKYKITVTLGGAKDE